MFKKMMLKKEAQIAIDNIYGTGEWEILDYNGGHEPCLAKHKCGLEKSISRFSTFKLGKTKCKCEHKNSGRPKISFDELQERISNLTYGTYELIWLKDSTDFMVNHKSCERPPFRTSSMRFFTRCQRCACSKTGKVGRKKKSESVAEINNLVMENQKNAN